MEKLPIKILQLVLFGFDHSSLLRMCILNKFFFNEVCSTEWWCVRYLIDKWQCAYLPMIPFLSTDISLFCRTMITKKNGTESVWNPYNIFDIYTYNIIPSRQDNYISKIKPDIENIPQTQLPAKSFIRLSKKTPQKKRIIYKHQKALGSF